MYIANNDSKAKKTGLPALDWTVKVKESDIEN